MEDRQFPGSSYTPAFPDPTDIGLPMSQVTRIWGARLNLSIASKSPLVISWVQADRMYLGKHWPNRQKSSWRPEPVSNQIYNIVDEHASQMAATDYDAIILPRKPSDTEAAEAFQDLWQWWHKRHRLRFIMDDVVVGSILKGTYLVKVIWSQDIKAGTENPEDIPPDMLQKRRHRKRSGEQAGDTDSGDAVTVASAMDGDVIAIGIDPSSFFIDPGAYDLQAAAWCGTLTPMLVSEAKARWPKYANRFNPEYSFSQSEIYYRPATFQSFQATQGEASGAYLNIFEGWEKSARRCTCGADKLPEKLPDGSPNPAYRPPGHEEGLVRVVMSGATAGEPLILERQPHFYRHGKYPFAVFKDIQIAKNFWGQGEVEQIKSLQEIRNRIIEQIAINAYLTANSQKLLLKGSNIDINTITNEPGKVYPSNHPQGLIPIKMESMPQYVFELLALTKTDIHEMTGIFTAPPPGIRAGYAIIALLERLAARVKRKSMRMEEGLREILELVIAYYQEFGTEARIARVTNSSGQLKFFPFQGTQYAQAELDVDISLGAAKPFSRAVLQEMMQPLLGMRYPDGSPAIMPSDYAEAIGLPLRSAINRMKQKEAELAAQQQGQSQGMAPEGAATLLGTHESQQQQVETPGPGRGSGRGPQSRLLEGVAKASGNG